MNSVYLNNLTDRFGIPGELAFRQGPGGMASAEISGDHATARIILQGAHIVDWTPWGQMAVLWLSPLARFAPGEAIRGGVPICWPWFGKHPMDPRFPAHGIARTANWEILETARRDDGSIFLRFQLTPGQANVELWPRNSPAELALTVGKTLAIELTTRNLESQAILISQALHAYFRVSDVRRIEILGLEGLDYIDKVDGGRIKSQSGPVTIAEEVDRIYLNSLNDCLITDSGFGRRIRVGKQGSRSTVVWNPWAEKSLKMADMGEGAHLSMVCVETANAANDQATIPPGGEYRLSTSYGVESV